MKRLSQIALCVALLALSSCKKEDPNPELLDPIYQDLSKRQVDAEKALEEQKKHLEEATKAVEKAEANTIEQKNARKDLAKAHSIFTQAEQDAHYYKIHAQRRLLVDRLSYKEAFRQNKPWPDPSEYSEYSTNLRLTGVPLNWGAHIPKLQTRLDPKAAKKPEKSEEGKAE